ncbi:hypothetical protein N5D53_14465 [Pseudomonas sp. GD03862]|uniref:hypothetical protein n=1 Tax=Pseudomonas sp. GD03862 TaxID=2975391 RepID=UPI002447C689|nr:hypothetical protein [Pseudomonas sp. GD03862]MDH0707726.1 hypothetical protein [Pseudomonas sp. GD03862]
MNVFKFLESPPDEYLEFLPECSGKWSNIKELAFMFDMLSRNIGGVQVPNELIPCVQSAIERSPYLVGRNAVGSNVSLHPASQIFDAGEIKSSDAFYKTLIGLRDLQQDCLFICSGRIALEFILRWKHALANKFFIADASSELPIVFVSSKQIVKALGLEK